MDSEKLFNLQLTIQKLEVCFLLPSPPPALSLSVILYHPPYNPRNFTISSSSPFSSLLSDVVRRNYLFIGTEQQAQI
jgi:hypothetical protein